MVSKKRYNGFIVYTSHQMIGKKSFVFLFGRLDSGKSFLAVNEYNGYFYVKKSDVNKVNSDLADLKSELLGNVALDIDTDGKKFGIKDFVSKYNDFYGDEVVRIVFDNSKDISLVKKSLTNGGVRCYESDIKYEQRFLMDLDVRGQVIIDGTNLEYNDFKKQSGFRDNVYAVDYFFFNADLSGVNNLEEDVPKIKVLSYDIETNRTARELYSISLYMKDYLYGESFVKNLVVNQGTVKNAESFDKESDLLGAFFRIVREWDPDVITGWNVVDFDFKVLLDLAKKYSIEYDMGRVSWPNRLVIARDFMRTSRADIPGRVVIDGIDMLKSNGISLTDYKLNTAAQEIINDKKLITEDDNTSRVEVIEEMFRKNPDDLVKYNQKDSELVLQIFEKKNLVDIMISRSLLTGMTLDKVQASVASLDSLYIRAARKRGIVCSSVMDSSKDDSLKGGYVMEPKPGIYDNVLVLDFKSLYPSIMITFNIDPYTYLDQISKKADNEKEIKTHLIQAPNGAEFSDKDGILGNIIASLWNARDLVKKKNDKIASHAIKIIMNSFYGALGNVGCRFFNMDISNAITSFGQFIIQDAAKQIEKKGYHVIYSDTDSVFVDVNEKSTKDAMKIGSEIETSMNKYLDKWVEENYAQKSVLELEFEKTYRKIIFPASRTSSEKGAKKRYAGMLVDDSGKDIGMDFTGLEFVRRDWTEVAKEFQLTLLNMIFDKDRKDEKPIINFVTKYVKDIKAGKLDDKLIYVKAIRKSLASYVRTTPPHVKAARKLRKLDSNVIKYYMTTDGPEPIQIKSHPIDYEHYISKQIRPIADSILVFFKTNLDDLIKGSVQKDLFSF